MWSAFGASVRLRVKPAVQGILIFAFALVTHRKFFHRRVRTVVRQRFDNRKPRPAICTVREWVTKPPVARVENFAQAIAASRDIGEDERCFVAALFAFADFKSVVADCIEKRGVNALHNCPGRLLRFDPLPKLLQKILTAFDFNENTLSRVRNVAVESQLRRQTVNKRAKPDSLHSTAHDYFQSFVVGTDGSPSR